MRCNLLFERIGVDFIGKTGRNDPCRCGSDKKYKKCCMQKDIDLKKQLITNKCVICSKKMSIEDIHYTVTNKIVEGDFKLQTTIPICSDECSIAFDLKEEYDEHPENDITEVINSFWISSELSNEDIRNAIYTLINNEEDPLRQELIDSEDFINRLLTD